jgi:hypothetical protein
VFGGVKALAKELLAERFYLARAERAARALDDGRRERLRVLMRAARARAQAAAALRSPEDTGPAFALMREAFALSVTAHVMATGQHEVDRPLSVSEAWQRVAPVSSAVAGELLAPLMNDTDPLAADRLTVRDALLARRELELVLAALLAGVELRTVRRIRVVRVARLLGLAAVLLGVLFASLFWLLRNGKAGAETTAAKQAMISQCPHPGTRTSRDT